MAAVPESIPREPPPAAVRDNQEFVPGRPNFPWLSQLTAQLLNVPSPETLTFAQIDLMRTDSAVDSAVELIKDLVLAEGCQIAAASVPDEERDRAVEMRDFIERNLPKTFYAVLEGLLESIYYGHAIAENVYETAPDGEDKGKLVLKVIKLKDRDACEMVVDKFWNITGIRATALAGDHVFPRVKFTILTLRKIGEDPRGRTSLRSCFAAWRFKQEIWPAYVRYLKTCAIPSLIGKLPPKAAPQPKVDDKGTMLVGADGEPVMVRAADALMEALLGMENATVAVVANATEVQALELVGDSGDLYDKAVEVANREIASALLRQTRATTEAHFGSKADSETGRSMLSYLIVKLRQKVAMAIDEDIIRPMVLWNFGAEAKKFTPHAALGETDRYDWATDADAASALAGVVTDSQWDQITEMLGLKPPQEGEERPKRGAQAFTPPGADPDNPDADPSAAPTGKPGAKPKKKQPEPAKKKGATA